MYATGGLKKFFRLMAMLLVIASVVGLLPISAIAEGFNTDRSAAEANDNASGEDTRAGETPIWTEDFSSVSLAYTTASYSSTNWFQYYPGTVSSWSYPYGAWQTTGGYAQAHYVTTSGNSGQAYLVSKPIAIPSGATELSFGWTDWTESASYEESYQAFLLTETAINSTASNVASASSIGTLCTLSGLKHLSTNKINRSFTFSNAANYAGQTVRLVFKYTSAYDQYYLYIDDVTVSATTAAPATTYTLNFNVNGNTSAIAAQTGLLDGDSVTLPTPTVDFSTTDEKYFIGWVTQSIATATPISGINPVYYVNSNSAYYTTPYTVDANAADSNDEITLYALFGNWDGTSETTLGSGTVSAELLNENFDNNFTFTTGSYNSTGWYTYNAGSSSYDWELKDTISSTTFGDYNAYHSSPYAMAVRYHSTYAKDNYLVSAPFVVDGNMAELSVSLYAESTYGSSYPEKFSVSFVKESDITTSDGSFNASALYSAIGTTTLNTDHVYAEYNGTTTAAALKGQTVRVVVHAESDADKDSIVVDDIIVSQTTTGGGTVPAYTNCTTVLHTTPTTTYTVNYYVNGNNLVSSLTESGVTSATLPTGSAAISAANINLANYEEDAFVVWVTAPVAKGSIQDLTGVTYYEGGATLTNAQLAGHADNNDVVNLYALFAEEGQGGGAPDYTFESVTTSQSYDFVIAAKVGNNYYPLPQQSSTSTGGRISSTTPITVQTSGNTVYVAAADAVGYTWTISSPANNAYRLYDGAHYLYNSVSGTNLRWDSGTNNYWTKGTAVNGTYRLVSTYATSRVLAYSAGTVQTFGAYATSNISSGSTQYYELEILPIGGSSGPAYVNGTYTTTLTPLAAFHDLTVNFVYAAGGTAAQTVTQQVREGQTYTVAVPEITGHTASASAGTISNGNLTGTMPTSDLTITVTYTPNSHTIHYSANYPTTGSYTNDVTVAYGETVTLPTMQVFEGYTLSWQWHEGSASGTVISQPSTMPDEDLWAVGTYQLNYHNVTFYVEGVQYAQVSTGYGTQLPPAGVADPTRDGYEFTGWIYSSNNGAYEGSTMPDYPLTATAAWRAVATAVRLVIDPNNVEIGGTATATATVTVGSGAVLGTDYFISWTITNGSDCAEFVGETINLSSVTLRGIAQGVATIRVTVSNGRAGSVSAEATLAVGRYVTGIAVTHLPDKVAYTTGSTFDSTGMVVQYVYNDGTYGEALTSSQYTVTAPNMNTANSAATVTVTANENSSWTDTFQINVHAATGTSDVWVPVTSIDPSKDYLIGFVVGNTVYLALCYSPTQSAYYYTNSSYVNFGYTGIATMDGVNVIGVSGNATSLDYAQWNFSSSSGGTISSVYGIGNSTDGYNTQYLNTWSSTSYSDLYPTTSSSQATNWHYSYDSATGQAVLYRTISSTNRYAQYYNYSTHLMRVTSDVPTNGYVQLYSKQTVDTAHTIVFYAPDGKTIVSTLTVEDGGYITASQLSAAQTAAMQGQTGNFNGWDYYGGHPSGLFTNEQIAAYPVTENCYFVANVGAPRWSVEFYEADNTTMIASVSVEQGQPLTEQLLADVNAPAVIGKEFVGWSDGTNTYTTQQLVGHTPAANETYTAVYSDINYTLTVHFVDGDSAGLTLPQDITAVLHYGETYNIPGVDNVSDPTAEYPKTIMLGNVPYVANLDAVAGSMPAANLTVNVTYKIKTYTVTFTYNDQNYTQTVAHGSTPSQSAFESACALPAQFSADNSTWTVDGNSIPYADAFTTAVTRDVTYTLNVGYNNLTATFYTVQSGELDNEGRLTYTELTHETVQYGAKPTTEPTVDDVVVNGSTYSFVGWIISYNNDTYDTAHVYSFADLPALTADTYYRAVYYNTDQSVTNRRYVLVEEPVDGMDYIIVDVGEEMAVTDENVTDNHYLVPVPVTLDYSEGGIEDYYCYVGSNITDEQIFWHFEQDGSNWKIKSSNGKYMTVTANNDGNYLTALASDSQNARWSYDSANHKLEIVSPANLEHKYLTYVGGASSKLAQYIGFNDAELIMHAVQSAQNNTQTASSTAKPAIEGTKAGVSEPTRATNTLLTQNFDSSFTLNTSYNSSGWYTYNASSSANYGWARNNSSSNAYSGSYSVRAAGNSTTNRRVKYLVSEPFTISSAASGVSLSFYQKNSSTSSHTMSAYLVLDSDITSTASTLTGATTYSLLTSTSYTNTSYTQRSGSLSSSDLSTLKGESVRLVIYFSSSNTSYMYIDDITVTQTVPSYTINYYVNGSLAYTDTGSGSSFSIMDFDDVTSNFSFSGYEQTNFIGWYSGTYSVSDTAPNLDYFYNPNTNYGLSANMTLNLYAMFAKDNTGSGITELASGHGMYVMQTNSSNHVTGTGTGSGYVLLIDAYYDRSLYASSTTAAGYVYSDTRYTSSNIVTDEFGNYIVDVNETSYYNHIWYDYYYSSNSHHFFLPMSSQVEISDYAVYYNSSYYLTTDSQYWTPVEFTYGGTTGGYPYFSMHTNSSGYDTYRYSSSSNYYYMNTSATTASTYNKFYVFEWTGYPYFVTDASRFSTSLTTAAVSYTVTVQNPTGGTITATPTTATAGTTINLTATPDANYTFGSWTVTDTTNNTTVTVTNNSFTMPAGNVTVTATFNYNGVQPTTVYYEPTSTIVVGEEYLIGYKVSDSEVYLLMNYNPNPIGSNNRYYNLDSNYYAYGVQAVMSGNNVVGIENTYSSATINNAEWVFENAEGSYYKIRSAYTTDNGQYYLRVYSNDNYTDLYASTSSITNYGSQWLWDSANNRLGMVYSTTMTKYVTYLPTVGNYSNFFHAPSTPSSVQLYRKRIGTTLDYRFTLNNGTTQPAGEIKLYGLAEDTHTPEVSVTPANQTLYWYNPNVVWYDESAEIVQQTTLVGAYANIDPATAVVTWATSDSSVVSITPNGNECNVTAEGVGVAVVTYSVTDIFGNVYTAQAQIIVEQAPMGEVPTPEDTDYSEAPHYTVYKEVTQFVDGEDYIIASVPSNTVSSGITASVNATVKLATGATGRVNLSVTSGSYSSVLYESTNTSVATVSSNGVITAVAPGVCCVYTAPYTTSSSSTTYYPMVTTVIVTEDGTDTSGRYIVTPVGIGGSRSGYDAASSNANRITYDALANGSICLYPKATNPSVGADYILYDGTEYVWTYNANRAGGTLKNKLKNEYLREKAYYTSASSSATQNWMVTLDKDTGTTVYYDGTRLYEISASSSSTFFYGEWDKISYTNNGGWAWWFKFSDTGNDTANAVNFRIFQRDDSINIPIDVTDDLQAFVDVYSARGNGGRTLISQDHVIYEDVTASDTFTLSYMLHDMPDEYTENTVDCEWELREQSMIKLDNGTYVPLVTGINPDGTFVINPQVTSGASDWQGYIIVGYVYSFVYNGEVCEVANYGKIYFSSDDYEMTQDDLPDFPEAGFVGIDKTATTPYGAFINTGIGKVELTNFGIPAAKPVDVVLILDVSGSMSDALKNNANVVKMAEAKQAAKSFAHTLLEGSYNSLSIVTFGEGASIITGSRQADADSFVRVGSLNSLEYYIDAIEPRGGTNFDAALKYAYQILYDNYNTYGDAHNRAVVFMTDGAPGYYNNAKIGDMLNRNNSATNANKQAAWAYWCLGTGSMASYFDSTTEMPYWSSNGDNLYMKAIKMDAGDKLTSSNFYGNSSYTGSTTAWVSSIEDLVGSGNAKGLGALVYSVGFDIASYGSDQISAQGGIGLSGTNAAICMQNNASLPSMYYDAESNLSEIFTSIASAIRLVAEEAVTTDTISEYFDLNVATGYSYLNSSDQTITGTAADSNVITYGYYELDDNYNVKLVNGQPVYHEVEHVTVTGTNDGGTNPNTGNQNYEAVITGATSDLLTGSCWKPNAGTAGQIQAKWFTYDVATKEFTWHINDGDRMEDKKMYSLSYSVRLLDEYRVEGSTVYPTNAHAEIEYKDVYGDHVGPIEYPIPELPWSGGHVRYEFYLVNEQGQPINTAGTVVPFSQRVIVYAGTEVKFHPTATASDTKDFRADEIIASLGLAYTLYDEDASYQVTINDDTYTSGAMTLVSNGATYVTGLPGHNQPYNVSGTENYTNGQCPVSTLVSFPVVFKLAINPDVIVVDYAVGVNVDVIANDLLPGTTSTAPLYAVGTVLPTSTIQTTYEGITATANLAAGFYTKANGAMAVTNAAGMTLGTAQIVSSGSKNVVRFTPTEYMISNPQVVDLYCAVQGSIPSAEGATVTTRQAYMYEKLTIVPANVMYYDDTYFNTTAHPELPENTTGAYVNGTFTMGTGYGSWVEDGTLDYSTVAQHTSRANDVGKPDVHGYDDTIGNYGGHSFNTAHTVRVKQYDASTFGSGSWPSMSFNFTGTGFEVVMDSETDAGNVVVMVYSGSTKIVSKIIDAYYGTGDLSQTPVVRIDLGSYGTYKVVISAVHNAYYAMMHEKDPDKTDTSITIDAIRVFNPINTDSNANVRGIYNDNKQANPVVKNIQELVIDSINLTAYNDIALYDATSGSKVSAIDANGGTYIIYSAIASGVLTNSNGTLGMQSLAVNNIANAPASAKWTFTPSTVENQYLDDDDTFARFTVSNNGYYLTVNNAEGGVEYGELATTTTNVDTVDFMNQWTYDGTRLIAGPEQIIQGQAANATHFRNVYYALSYYSSFTAVTSVAPSQADVATTFNKLVHIDGGSTLDPEVYKTIGPNNEVYILPDSALTFKLYSEQEPAGVYVELKSTKGNTIKATMFSSNAETATSTTEELETAMGMYYSVTDKLVWTRGNPANGEDSRLWYSSPLVIFNATNNSSIVTRPEDYILSVCNIKLTYEAAATNSTTSFGSIPARQYEQIVNSLEALEWNTYSPLFDLNVHSSVCSNFYNDGTHVSGRGSAYITVVTSTDVAGLVVKDAAGRQIDVKNCSFTDANGIRTWQLRIDRTSNNSYNVYVTTISAVFDMVNPTAVKVVVPCVFNTPGSITRPIDNPRV